MSLRPPLSVCILVFDVTCVSRDGQTIQARAGLRVLPDHSFADSPPCDLQARFASLTVCEGPRWIDNDRVVTSAGINAGMDMSLHLVERVTGKALAQRTARQMNYRWID